jgi:hypothetical protein
MSRYDAVKPLMGDNWQVGRIENHVAKPLTHGEVVAVCALLNSMGPSAEWLLAQCEEYQRRAHAAEREVLRLRAEQEARKP